MLSDTMEAAAAISADDDAADSFAAAMAEGLHALAQPLTILRSTIALMASPDTPDAGRRRYLDLSTEQVQRACDLFETMQDLVITNQVEAIRTPFPPSQAIAAAIDDPKMALEVSGVTVNGFTPGDLPLALGDYARTLQALVAALKIAISLSSAGDSVEVLATPSGGFVRLAVGSARTHGRTLNSSERLNLALAEANIRSQSGKFKLAEDPFCVSMELPFAG